VRAAERVLLESHPVADRSRATLPWLLVASSVLLLGLLLYVMFVNYIPTKQRVTELEAELKQIYSREMSLQTRMAQQDQRSALREQQVNALRAERDALARRIDELEKQLGAAKPTARKH
jgi:septal ring factor EnvC (AmiA/AmiB activator)